MIEQKLTYNLSGIARICTTKVADYCSLMKMRLSLTVVFSAMIGFVFAGGLMGIEFLFFALAGLMITGSANAINQIWERDLDKLMPRTQNRPLASKRMSVTEATLFSGIVGVSGIGLLSIMFNPFAGVIGAMSLFSYAFIYTPLKRLTSFAVFVGAIPGALPPLIGWAAVTGSLSAMALVLFFIQFIWQMPHFWAIAWVADKDYKNAGFSLLPVKEGVGKNAALMILIYNGFLLAISLLPFFLFGLNPVFILPVALCGIYFTYQALALYRNPVDRYARKVMFSSFAYLPLVFIFLYLSKIIVW